VSEPPLGTMTFGGRSHPVWGLLGGLGLDDVDRLVGTALDAGIKRAGEPAQRTPCGGAAARRNR
jgi:hypothetical protein